MQNKTIKDVMTTNVKSVRPDANLVEVAKMMRDGDFGAVPIEDNGKAMGILTDRDIVVRVAAEGKDLGSTTVRQAMSDKILTCHEDDSVEEVGRMMGENQVRRILVVDKNDKLVGIFSLGDLATERGADNISEEALTKISKESQQTRNLQ